MKKRMLIVALVVVMIFAFGTTAYAKNFSIAFNLEPNGPSRYSGDGYKVDTDTKCYITTTSGTAIDNNLTYKMRGKRTVTSGSTTYYYNATGLGQYSGPITSRTLNYIDPYKTQIANGNYGNYTFALAASLHSGSGTSYSINGRWNP